MLNISDCPLVCCRWYHGKVSREQVEKLLYPREDGLFLVRDSNNFVGDYTLCVWCANKVENYHIKYENNQLTIDDECFFKNLEELVSVLFFILYVSIFITNTCIPINLSRWQQDGITKDEKKMGPHLYKDCPEHKVLFISISFFSKK